jgi:stage III sporulation protein AF
VWDGFAALLRNLTALTLCITLIDWLLPAGSMRKYARLVCGLVMLWALLRPISAVFIGSAQTDQMMSGILQTIMGGGS